MRVNVKYRKFEVEFDAEQILQVRIRGEWYATKDNGPVGADTMFSAEKLTYYSVLGDGSITHCLNLDHAERVSIRMEK